MAGGEEAAPRRGRAPLRQRSRRRWAIAGGVAAGWLVLEVMTGSAVSATLVLVAIAALAGASLAGLRALGITRDHPWLQRMASRPWRNGQDVLDLGLVVDGERQTDDPLDRQSLELDHFKPDAGTNLKLDRIA